MELIPEHWTTVLSENMTKLNARILLLAMRDQIDLHGHSQACFDDDKGLSLLGAKALVSTSFETAFAWIPSYSPSFPKTVQERVVLAIQSVIKETCLLQWNSREGRTKEEVLAVLNKAVDLV